MLFNSVSYLLFLPFVILVYFQLNLRARQYFLLSASYFFYLCWKPEYIGLILLSTAVDFVAGKAMAKAGDAKRQALLVLSLTVNLGLLFIYKYLGFFAEIVADVSHQFGHTSSFSIPALILPVGISFYTFQTLSYTIDVYRGNRKPETDLVTFALYVTFFPQLVAGPIERSTRLLPQLKKEFSFCPIQATSGLRWILVGLFKKVVIADRAAHFVDPIFSDPAGANEVTSVFATVCFAIQIYCDFSGYSDIAIGSARILGIDLMQNFRQPYFSTTLAEFWRRWHISLSTWFRDYVYFPLGGSRVDLWKTCRNLMLVFLVSGLWHGANWTFVVWGLIHGCVLVLEILLVRFLGKQWALFSSGRTRATRFLLVGLRWALTQTVVLVGWVFFRAESVPDAITILTKSWTGGAAALELARGNVRQLIGNEPIFELFVFVFAVALLFIHDVVDNKWGQDQALDSLPAVARWCIYYFIILFILSFGISDAAQFIYFQF